MHMIHADFYLFKSNVISLSNLCKQLVETLSNGALQDRFAVFGRPDQMILCVINCMRCSSYSHTAIVTDCYSTA